MPSTWWRTPPGYPASPRRGLRLIPRAASPAATSRGTPQAGRKSGALLRKPAPPRRPRRAGAGECFRNTGGAIREAAHQAVAEVPLGPHRHRRGKRPGRRCRNGAAVDGEHAVEQAAGVLEARFGEDGADPWRRPAITWASRRASTGATPSNGSSRRRSRLPAIIARASATSFCWPPERCAPCARAARTPPGVSRRAADGYGSANRADQAGSSTFSSTLRPGTSRRSSGM